LGENSAFVSDVLDHLRDGNIVESGIREGNAAVGGKGPDPYSRELGGLLHAIAIDVEAPAFVAAFDHPTEQRTISAPVVEKDAQRLTEPHVCVVVPPEHARRKARSQLSDGGDARHLLAGRAPTIDGGAANGWGKSAHQSPLRRSCAVLTAAR